jgi:hypothetical protein
LWILPLPKDFLFGEAIVPLRTPREYIQETTRKGPPRISLFSVFLYWAKRMKNQDIISLQQDPRTLMQPMLCLVCAEWLTFINYVSTRLSQIEWELANPEFRQPVKGLSATLEKLHPWRQRIPSFKKIASGSLESDKNTCVKLRVTVQKSVERLSSVVFLWHLLPYIYSIEYK